MSKLQRLKEIVEDRLYTHPDVCSVQYLAAYNAALDWVLGEIEELESVEEE